MRILRVASQVTMSVGMVALVLSFTALLHDRWGSGVYLAGGLILLAAGAVMYWVTSRGRRHDQGAREIPAEPNNRWQLSKIVGYISLLGYLAMVIYITVVIISEGRDGAILFLLWVIFAGFLALLLARTFLVKGK